MRTIRTFLLICLTLALSIGVAYSQGVSEYMPYQGFLTDSTGTPIDGFYNLTFKLYETSDAPTALWEETISGVPVSGGAFAVSLGGVSPNMKTYMTDGRAQYLSIAVNGESVSPRQRIGSQAYAYLAYNASKLGGHDPAYFATLEQLNELTLQAGAGLTQAQVDALIDLRGYLSQEQITNLFNSLIDGRGYVDTNTVNALIDARGYVNTDTVNALIDARGYVNTDTVNALIDARGYVNTDTVNALIDAREYLNANDVNALIDARAYLNANDVNALIDAREYLNANDVNALIDAREYVTGDEVQNLIDAAVAVAVNNLTQTFTQQIENLETQINNVTVNGVEPEVLGLSEQTSDGSFSFDGFNGIRAANRMCEVSYSNVDTAHFCSVDEVTRALALGNVDASVDNVETWTIASSVTEGFNGNQSLFNTCQNLLYHSGDAANGTFLKVNLAFTSAGGGGQITGDVIDVIRNRGCGNERKVLCCR